MCVKIISSSLISLKLKQKDYFLIYILLRILFIEPSGSDGLGSWSGSRPGPSACGGHLFPSAAARCSALRGGSLPARRSGEEEQNQMFWFRHLQEEFGYRLKNCCGSDRGSTDGAAGVRIHVLTRPVWGHEASRFRSSSDRVRTDRLRTKSAHEPSRNSQKRAGSGRPAFHQKPTNGGSVRARAWQPECVFLRFIELLRIFWRTAPRARVHLNTTDFMEE